MRILQESEITNFLNNHNYDVRCSGNARWIDQKCTPDVLTLIADCILSLNEKMPLLNTFTSRNIWESDYAKENIAILFKKPKTDEPLAANEYDKFFQQPMELFAYAKILTKSKIGRFNNYSIANKEILEYISLREKNSLIFLRLYIVKVLTDSDLIQYFNNFLKTPNKSSYSKVKQAFTDFTRNHTAIKGVLECSRIFTKIINPLAFFANSQGSERGHVSKNITSYDMLMYNRDNFRDIYAQKPKDKTRQEFLDLQGIKINPNYVKYLSVKAKRFLKAFNDEYRNGLSEVNGIDDKERATHIHHIFPESEFAEISNYLENLIALTPTQHLNYAHPNGRTNEICEQFQNTCLIAKSGIIQENILQNKIEPIYDFNNFIYVLTCGLSETEFSNIKPLDFEDLILKINYCYSHRSQA